MTPEECEALYKDWEPTWKPLWPHENFEEFMERNREAAENFDHKKWMETLKK